MSKRQRRKGQEVKDPMKAKDDTSRTVKEFWKCLMIMFGRFNYSHRFLCVS